MTTRNLSWGVNPNTSKLDSRYDENGNEKIVLLGRANFTDGQITPSSIRGGYTWSAGSASGGVLAVENGALRMDYPAITLGNSGEIFNALHFNIPQGIKELYIKFDAKMPNAKHGLKFCKIFGKRDPQNSSNYSNTTFALDYTGLDYGAMRYIGFGDGSTVTNDTHELLLLNGSDPTYIGRSYGVTASVTTAGKYFNSSVWGTGFHTFRLKIKFNDGTTAGNEVANGEIFVSIDGEDYVSATGLFNRHYSNLDIEYISFGDWTQTGGSSSPAFDIHFDNIFISQNGFYEGS